MATHEPVNFSGSSSNRTAWRRVSSDGGAQLRAENVGGKSPGIDTSFKNHSQFPTHYACNSDALWIAVYYVHV